MEGLRGMEGEGRLDAIKAKIRAEAERVAGAVELGDEVHWGQAGLDSLSLVEMRNALQRKLGEAVRLSNTVLFDDPCVEALAHHIEAALLSKPASQTALVAGLESSFHTLAPRSGLQSAELPTSFGPRRVLRGKRRVLFLHGQ